MSDNPGWHPPPQLLRSYATGRSPAASVEAHLVACAACRAAVRPLADTRLVTETRAQLLAELHAPPRPWIVRLAERCGLRDSEAVLISASNAMSTTWLVSLVLTVGFTLLANLFAGDLGVAVFLLLAPLVPVVGVAVLYQSSQPSLERIGRAAPYASMRLVLVRTLAVLAASLPLCLVAAVVVHHEGAGLVGWLLPSLAFTVLALALGAWIAIELACTVVSLGWAVIVGVLFLGHSPAAAVEARWQVLYLLLAVAAAIVLARRVRRGFTPGGIG